MITAAPPFCLLTNSAIAYTSSIEKAIIADFLSSLEIDGDPIEKVPENFWPVFDINNEKIGRLSRCFFSPRLKKNIGLAIIDINYTEPGTALIIESPKAHLNAQVHALPWFSAEKSTNLD